MQLTRVTRPETIEQSERRSAEDVQGRRAAVAAAVSAVPEQAGKVAAVVVVGSLAAGAVGLEVGTQLTAAVAEVLESSIVVLGPDSQ